MSTGYHKHEKNHRSRYLAPSKGGEGVAGVTTTTKRNPSTYQPSKEFIDDGRALVRTTNTKVPVYQSTEGSQ